MLYFLNEARKRFIQNHTVHLSALFRFLDQEGKGYLVQDDFLDFSLKYHHQLMKKTCDYFIYKNWNREWNKQFLVTQRAMNYQEFLWFVFGNEKTEIKDKLCLYTKEKYLLPEFTLEDFQEFLVKMEVFFKWKEEQCWELRREFGYIGGQAFNLVQPYQEKYLTYENVGKFLLEDGYSLDREVFKAVVAETDWDGDGEINREEFQTLTTPFGFSEWVDLKRLKFEDCDQGKKTFADKENLVPKEEREEKEEKTDNFLTRKAPQRLFLRTLNDYFDSPPTIQHKEQ